MAIFSEARPFLPIDLPLMRRLTAYGVSLDSATSLTRGIHMMEGAFWSALPLTDLGTPTLVLRTEDSGYVAQFRHKLNDQHAHIVFIAPDLRNDSDESAWLALIDAMVYAAGKRGALTLNAEVDENSDAFVLLRSCGFAVYARQQIWRLAAGTATNTADSTTQPTDLLRIEAASDAFSISALYNSIVPRLVLQADAPPETDRGLVCEQNGRVNAYFAVQEGRNGVYVQPFLHPEMYDQATAVHRALLAHLPRAERCPVYVCVRRYQDWLREPLSELGFEPWSSQAVMVKHTTARIEQPLLRPIMAFERAVQVAGPPVRAKIQ